MKIKWLWENNGTWDMRSVCCLQVYENKQYKVISINNDDDYYFVFAFASLGKFLN